MSKIRLTKAQAALVPELQNTWTAFAGLSKEKQEVVKKWDGSLDWVDGGGGIRNNTGIQGDIGYVYRIPPNAEFEVIDDEPPKPEPELVKTWRTSDGKRVELTGEFRVPNEGEPFVSAPFGGICSHGAGMSLYGGRRWILRYVEEEPGYVDYVRLYVFDHAWFRDPVGCIKDLPDAPLIKGFLGYVWEGEDEPSAEWFRVSKDGVEYCKAVRFRADGDRGER